MQIQSPSEEQIRCNYRQICGLVGDAAERTGRARDSVRILGVTKYVSVETAGLLAAAGCLDLAESRPQSLWDKAAKISLPVRWHLIGHLQRNKARRTLPLLSTMQSLDSMRLLEQLMSDALALGVTVPTLLEVNVSGDADKTGITEVEAVRLLDAYVERSDSDRSAIPIVGLMGMGSLDGGHEAAHRAFSRLRELRDEWQVRFGLLLPELSMGMSDDFEIGIEHGATIVRIGSRLFSGSPHRLSEPTLPEGE